MSYGMADLSKVDPAGDGDYLDSGEYLVTVTESKPFSAHNGTRGVEFTLTANNGQKTRLTHWLTEKAMSRLRKFADDCGIKPDQLPNWSPDMHHGKSCIVTVERDGDYHKGTRTRPAGVGDPPAGRSEHQAPKPEPSAYDQLQHQKNEDLPF